MYVQQRVSQTSQGQAYSQGAATLATVVRDAARVEAREAVIVRTAQLILQRRRMGDHHAHHGHHGHPHGGHRDPGSHRHASHRLDGGPDGGDPSRGPGGGADGGLDATTPVGREALQRVCEEVLREVEARAGLPPESCRVQLERGLRTLARLGAL
jgi:hypothetical protein